MKARRKAPAAQPPARGGGSETVLDAELLQSIENKAVILSLAIGGLGPDDDAVVREPVVMFAKQLHSDILTLMEIANVEV